MLRIKFAALLPALLIIGTQVLADEPGQRPSRPRADQYPPQQQEQQEPAYDPSQQYYCDGVCDQAPMPYPPAILAPVPLPPPVILAPLPPPVIAPYPPPVLPPIYGPRPTPYGHGYGRPGFGYGRPGYGYGRPGMGGPGYGYGRPGFGRPGYGPRPTPYGAGGAQFRRMSMGGGCEIQRGNNGEVVVLSTDGMVLYSDRSVHAEANAAAMKAYYERPKFEFCADTNFSAPRTTEQDI